MSKDLVPRTPQTQLRRWARSPTIVPVELRRKEALTLRERLWVYWPLLALPCSLSLVTAMIVWLDMRLTWTGFAITTLVLAISASAFLFFATIAVCAGVGDPFDPRSVNQTRVLNWTGRKRLVLYDRNRRRMPWAGARTLRPYETDGEYRQFSVWASPNNGGVQLRVLEHVKRERWGPWIPLEHAARGSIATKWVTYDDAEELVEAIHTLEEYAKGAEQEAYKKAYKEHEQRRDILSFRR